MITDDLFDDYIAISPNCCYDEYRLATDIENHQFKNRKAPRFIYTSMSGEIDDGPEYWGDDWKAGWERVSAVLKDKSHFPENTVTSVHTFPSYGHYNGFMPSLTAALNDYIVFGAKNLVSYVGEETCPVHIELHGRNLTDDIYITGNQNALGNWEAKGVKMTLNSDSVAFIDLLPDEGAMAVEESLLRDLAESLADEIFGAMEEPTRLVMLARAAKLPLYHPLLLGEFGFGKSKAAMTWKDVIFDIAGRIKRRWPDEPGEWKVSLAMRTSDAIDERLLKYDAGGRIRTHLAQLARARA